MTAMIEYDADGEFEMVPDEDVELVYDPDLGPVGKGPHEPRPSDFEVYVGRDGRIKIIPKQKKTDDGQDRYVWDAEDEKYISPLEAAKKGEARHQRAQRPSHVFIPDDGDLLDELDKQGVSAAEHIRELMKKYLG